MKQILFAFLICASAAQAQTISANPNAPAVVTDGDKPTAAQWMSVMRAQALAAASPALAGKCGFDASACTVTAGGTTPRTLAQIYGKQLQIEAFAGLHADRVTDDTAVLQAALSVAVSSGTYALELGPKGYLVDSANLTIPPGVRLTCSGGRMGEALPTTSVPKIDYTQMPCTIVLNPAYTILRGAQSVIDGVNVIAKTYVAPTTLRQAINLVAGFSGTALTTMGSDTWIRNSTVLGFAVCSTNNGQMRERISHLWGDCTNGLYNSQSHDISRYDDVHLWPFLTVHTSWVGNGNYSIRGFSNNGSGGVRVTWAAPTGPNAPAIVEAPVTGDLVFVTTSSDQAANTYGTEAQGVPYSMHGKWTVSVVDSTHFDLQGSIYPPPTGVAVTTTAGNTIAVTTAAAPYAACGPGMTISGTGVAGGATVTGVYQNQIVMSAAATASGSTTATCAPVSGLAGGAATIDPFYRNGTAFHWDNGEHNTCDHCFDYDHEIGFHFGNRAGWTECNDCSSDAASNQSGTSSAFYIAAGAYNTMVHGGYVGNKGYGVFLTDTTNSPAQMFSGVSFNAGSLATPTFNLQAGNIIVTGSALAPNGVTADVNNRGSVFLAAGMAVGSAIFNGNNLGLAKFQAASASAAAVLVQGSNVSGGGP